MSDKNNNLPARQELGIGLIDEGLLSPSMFAGSPWQAIRKVQDEMDRVFMQLLTGGPAVPGTQGIQAWAPTMDVSETDKEWRIELDLPGVKKDDIDVQIQNDQLRVSAKIEQETTEPQSEKQEQQGRTYYRRERRYGSFERVFALPENVDQEHIACEFKNGVLAVHLPKTEPQQPAGRHIPIGEAAGASGGETVKANQQPNQGNRGKKSGS